MKLVEIECCLSDGTSNDIMARIPLHCDVIMGSVDSAEHISTHLALMACQLNSIDSFGSY